MITSNSKTFKFANKLRRRWERGDLANFNTYNGKFLVVAYQLDCQDNGFVPFTSMPNVKFDSADFFILLDIPCDNRVDIFHPTHGVLAVPIHYSQMNLICPANENPVCE